MGLAASSLAQPSQPAGRKRFVVLGLRVGELLGCQYLYDEQ